MFLNFTSKTKTASRFRHNFEHAGRLSAVVKPDHRSRWRPDTDWRLLRIVNVNGSILE